MQCARCAGGLLLSECARPARLAPKTLLPPFHCPQAFMAIAMPENGMISSVFP